MIIPHPGRYHGKAGPYAYIPAIVGHYDPCPLYAVGSIVWVRGRTQSRVCRILAVTANGQRLLIHDIAGLVFPVRFNQVYFLGPTRFRAWAVQQFVSR